MIGLPIVVIAVLHHAGHALHARGPAMADPGALAVVAVIVLVELVVLLDVAVIAVVDLVSKRRIR